MSVPLPIRVAAGLLWFTAFGFGVFCVPAIRSLLAGRGIPYVMGFPAYGAGPFERHGVPTTALLVTGFLAICILEGVAGWWLWRGYKSGAILAIALLPAGAVYWWGFALPIPPLFAITRTVLLALNWQGLR